MIRPAQRQPIPPARQTTYRDKRRKAAPPSARTNASPAIRRPGAPATLGSGSVGSPVSSNLLATLSSEKLFAHAAADIDEPSQQIGTGTLTAVGAYRKASVDFRIKPEPTASAGARYSKDDKRMHVQPLINSPGQNYDSCVLDFISGKKSWDDVSPRFAFHYKVQPNIMLSASYLRGYGAAKATIQGHAQLSWRRVRRPLLIPHPCPRAGQGSPRRTQTMGRSIRGAFF